MQLLFISGQEIFVIMLIVLLLFGADKIPDIARGLGKGMNEFKKATEDIKREMQDQSKELTKDVEKIKEDLSSKLKDGDNLVG